MCKSEEVFFFESEFLACMSIAGATDRLFVSNTSLFKILLWLSKSLSDQKDFRAIHGIVEQTLITLKEMSEDQTIFSIQYSNFNGEVRKF